MQKNTVTFVIPTYIKSAVYLKFLKHTLDGVILQSDANWNAIIIEDFSPIREVKELISTYVNLDARIHVKYLKERKTTGECRNIGIQWAKERKSPIILFNDADDVSSPNRVKWVREIFDNNNVSVVYSAIKVIDEHSRIVPEEKLAPPLQEIIQSLKQKPPIGKNCWYEIGLETGYVNVTSSVAVKTQLATKELFPHEFVAEDSHTWFRYAAQGDYYFDKREHCKYRVPSFVERQSSNSYTKDFNRSKVKVEIDGFYKALEISTKRERMKKESQRIIKVKFLMRLIESMRNDSRLDLVNEIILECASIISEMEDGITIK